MSILHGTFHEFKAAQKNSRRNWLRNKWNKCSPNLWVPGNFWFICYEKCKIEGFPCDYVGSWNCIIHNPQSLGLCTIIDLHHVSLPFHLENFMGSFHKFSQRGHAKISWTMHNDIHAWWSLFKYYLSVYCKSCKVHLSQKLGSLQCSGLIILL